MKYITSFLICVFYTCNTYAEKVPAGYVAKWETTNLSELDYEIKVEKSCQSFEGTLKKGKLEMPHIIPFKIINKTLTNFIKGYKINNKDNNLDLVNKVDFIYTFPNRKAIHTYLKYNNYRKVMTLPIYMKIISAENILLKKLNFLGKIKSMIQL